MELGALVIMKRSGELLAMNPAARRILTAEDAGRLAEMVAGNCSAGEDGRLVRWDRPDGQSPWLLWLTPMENGSSNPALCGVAIYETRPDFVVDSAVLTALFRLTKAETRLAERVAAGLSPADAAKDMGVTIYTVRTYLKRLYLKMGVRTQAALVRKLLQCAKIPVQRP